MNNYIIVENLQREFYIVESIIIENNEVDINQNNIDSQMIDKLSELKNIINNNVIINICN